MFYIFCYKLIRLLSSVIGQGFEKTTHSFLVIWWDAAVLVDQFRFVRSKLSHGRRSPHTRNNEQNVQTRAIQCFQIASIRTALVSFITTLGISRHSSDLGCFFLF